MLYCIFFLFNKKESTYIVDIWCLTIPLDRFDGIRSNIKQLCMETIQNKLFLTYIYTKYNVLIAYGYTVHIRTTSNPNTVHIHNNNSRNERKLIDKSRQQNVLYRQINVICVVALRCAVYSNVYIYISISTFIHTACCEIIRGLFRCYSA